MSILQCYEVTVMSYISSKLNLYYRFLLVILQMFSERYSVEQTQVIYFKWIIVWLCSYFKNNHQVQLRNQPLHSKVNVIILITPDWCGSVDWVPACEPKGCWFDSQSGHMHGLQARSPVGVVREGNWSMFSPCLSSSLPLSLKIN